MTTTYADLASLKDWLGATDDDRNDYKLATALLAATGAIDDYCHRTFAKDTEPTERYVTPHAYTSNLFTPDIADRDSVSIAIDTDGQGDFTDVEGFIVSYHSPGNPVRHLDVHEMKLYPSYTVRVTALFGWPEIPVQVEQACLILAARYFKRHASPEGITEAQNTFGPMRVGTRDYDVEALLTPFKLQGWA